MNNWILKYKTTSLPKSVDYDKINDFYYSLLD